MAKTTRRIRSRARPTRTTGERLDAVMAQSLGASAPVMPMGLPSHDQIASMAYEIWLKNGCPPDHEVENWLEAERQLAT